MRSSVPNSSSERPSSMSIARRRTVTGMRRLRSTFTDTTSRVEVSNSSQAPRFGINFAPVNLRPVAGSISAVK